MILFELLIIILRGCELIISKLLIYKGTGDRKLNARILIAAPKSGSGKTTITCALLKCLKNKGIEVAAFKCGPDYIDPMFHKKVLGIKSKNLDLFFTDEDATRELFCFENTAELSVIEGVMGLYDGLGGVNIEASSYHLARTLKTPIILVVDAYGCGRSVVAEIAGFLSMDAEHLIKGVILNRVSAPIYESLKPVIEHEVHIPVLGHYPNNEDVKIESRYLGLTLPTEIEGINETIDMAAEILEENVNIKSIVRIAEEAEEITADNWLDRIALRDESMADPVRIAVAYDRAFCFYYEDNLRLLEENGAKLVQFSPIKDKELPENVSGIIIGGGYPELFAEKLSKNESMKKSIKAAIESGMPSLAECGGFMYLSKSITTEEGDTFDMVGCIDGECSYTGHLSRFGYLRLEDKQGAFLKDEINNMIRGHEFHYYDSTMCGEDCVARKPVGGRKWDSSFVSENHWWGFTHLYYPSNPDFAANFVNECRKWRNYESR